jgi:hypothetical protein
MLHIPMPQVVLDEPRITPLIGQRIAAAMTQHVRGDVHQQAGALSDRGDQVVNPDFRFKITKPGLYSPSTLRFMRVSA